MTTPLLEIEDLTVTAPDPDGGRMDLVAGVSLTLREHEVLCVVGESGSGKSVTMLAALGLLAPGLRVESGRVRHRGEDLLDMPESRWRAIRGRVVSMVFQDPMTSLNPVKRIGAQIARAVRLHQNVSRKEAWDRAVALLESVGVPDAATRAGAYPHQWSGGMRQRAMIAMAIANDPEVLVADEPTTALDVTVQAQVMSVLEKARRATGAAMVLITHDLGLVAQVADRVAIMYSGRIVEQGTVWDIFERPAHPYTQGLLASLLTAEGIGRPARAIEGSPPAPQNRPAGCAFAPRCAHPAKSDACAGEVPTLRDVGDGQIAACHHARLPMEQAAQA
jgi:peptide/nickel transport system ATP-binding protein